jgi:hypothetical protein
MLLKFTRRRNVVLESGIIPTLDIIPTLSYVGSTTGVAPFGVVVNCVGTTTNDPSINPFHDLTYLYKVSDTGLGNYTNGQLAGTAKNRFVGGPVFSVTLLTPGTQTIDVYATYDGVNVWHATQLSFTVQDPDVVYPTTSTVVVSTSGNFAGKPTGATEVTSSDFYANLNTYAASNKRILFREGETFTTGTSFSKGGGTTDLFIGAFPVGGTGKAVVNATAVSIVVVGGAANGSNPANNPNKWRVTRLDINANTFSNVTGLSPGIITDATGDANIKNYTKGYFTAHDVITRDCGTGFGFNALGCVLSKCSVVGINYGTAFGGRYGVFGGGTIHSGITDCSLDNNHGGEHSCRIQGGDYSAFISNTFSRPAIGKYYSAQRGWAVITPANKVDAQYNNWAYNLYDGSVATQLTLWTQIAPQNDGQNEPIRDLIHEGNHYKGAQFAEAMKITALELSIRNNTCEYPAFAGEVSTSNAVFITLRAPSVSQTFVNSGIRIYNNSFYRAGIGGFSFIKCDLDQGDGRIGAVAPIVKGNLVYSPLSTRDGNGNGPGPNFEQPLFTLPVGSVVGQNSSDSDIKNTNPLFVGPTTTQAGFALQATSPYKNAGADYKVHVDAVRKLRVGPNFDAGAMNAPDKQVSALTLIP